VLVIAQTCFVNRLDKLQEASQRLAQGDHQVKVAEYVAVGELGRLGHSFDEMARQLAGREQALRSSEAEFRFLAENSADIIWRIGADRRIEYISPADECLRGYPKDEVIGHYIEEMVPPDDAALLLEMQAKRLEQEQQGVRTGALRFEVSLLRKDGGTIWAEVISSPIRDENGQIIGYHGVARDIGARKRAEEEREALIAELQDALGEIKTLSGMLPICASCKKIRDDSGYWNQLEIYISKHSDVMFSHGLCPDCLKAAYEELEEFAKAKTDC
jgi:PAS domain S-box-containing protein